MHSHPMQVTKSIILVFETIIPQLFYLKGTLCIARKTSLCCRIATNVITYIFKSHVHYHFLMLHKKNNKTGKLNGKKTPRSHFFNIKIKTVFIAWAKSNNTRGNNSLMEPKKQVFFSQRIFSELVVGIFLYSCYRSVLGSKSLNAKLSSCALSSSMTQHYVLNLSCF